MNENPEAESEPQDESVSDLANESPLSGGSNVEVQSDLTAELIESSGAESMTSAEIIEGDEVTVAATPADVETPRVAYRPKLSSADAPPVAVDLEGIAANGGSVGALVLGIWSILGSFLTYWSMINGILGLMLGVWGLASRKPRLAWIGILLSVVGCFMSMMEVGEIVSKYWNVETDPEF